MIKSDKYHKTVLKESYWSADTSSVLREWSVGEELRKAAAEVPDRIALVDGVPDSGKRRRWTYAQLLADAERVASALLKKFEPGERVAVWSPNSAEWVLLEYGSAIAGVILVTINPQYRERELHYVLDLAKVSGLFVVDEYRGFNTLEASLQAQKDLPSLREVICFSDFEAFINTGNELLPFPEVKPYDPYIVMWTSGTTGAQKGALLHHMGCLNSDFFVAERCELGDGGCWVNPLPLFHIAACGLAVFGCLTNRAKLVILPGLDVPLMLELMGKEKCTMSLLVPTVLEAFLASPDLKKHDLSSLKNIMTDGSKPIMHLVRKLRELGITTTVVYGQTETHGVTTCMHTEDLKEYNGDKILHSGQPMPQCEMKIADPETGSVLPLHTQGEIQVRGYQKMKEYYNLPEQTAQTIDSEGWLHTGDLGTMDEHGFVNVTGRLKDMLRRGGENIYPREIEILLEEHPKVDRAIVIGVPDSYWGEEVGAIIIPKSLDDKPEYDELLEYCRERLTSFKKPVLWHTCALEAIPMSTTGRIQKFKIIEQIKSGEIKMVRTKTK